MPPVQTRNHLRNSFTGLVLTAIVGIQLVPGVVFSVAAEVPEA
jgi:hypothetical protein